MWIPSHAGTKGKELVEIAANTAIKNTSKCTIISISSNDVHISIRNKIMLPWQKHRNTVPSSTEKLKSIKNTVKQWFKI